MLNIATIICHYNYNNYLKRAIESCLNQTYRNYICVIDDNSNEKPTNILTELFGNPVERNGNFYFQDKAVLILNDKNYGPSYSRNRGIKECGGFNCYAVLDADDYMLDHKIEKMAKIMEDPNIAFVYGDYYICNEMTGLSSPEYKHPYDIFLLQNDCIVHSGAMLSAKHLDMVKLSEDQWYDNTLRVAEDYNLWLRLSRVGIGYHIPDFLTLVTNHPNNSTYSVPPEIWQDNLARAKQV